MVFIDQEGGSGAAAEGKPRLCAVAERKGIQPSAPDHKRAILTASFAEMRRLGIHYDFAPVIDVDYNPENPNIGSIKRPYSADIAEVEANALLASEVARAERIGLCLKHFPGIGGAVVDSHQEFMDISDALRDEQEELFYSLAPKMFGDAVLVSHAIVEAMGQGSSDDLVRGGDRPFAQAPSGHAADHRRYADAGIAEGPGHQGGQPAIAEAGMDMLCIGNNLFDQEQEMAAVAEDVEQGLRDKTLSGPAIEKSIARVARRKALLMA